MALKNCAGLPEARMLGPEMSVKNANDGPGRALDLSPVPVDTQDIDCGEETLQQF